MVLVSGPDGFKGSKNGVTIAWAEWLRVLPQIRKGKALVRHVIVSVSIIDNRTGERQVTEMERDLAKMLLSSFPPDRSRYRYPL